MEPVLIPRRPKVCIRPKNPDLPYGVYRRNCRKPFIVKFSRKQGHLGIVYVGSYLTLGEAIDAAANYLAKESLA